MFKVAIVGSGPSGLFLTKNLLKIFKNNVKIDIFEKLPEPLGLLKFGVAPDHPEVKEKFMRHFDSIFDSNNVNIFVNSTIGNQLKLSEIKKCYDAIALCTGMSDSKRNWDKLSSSYGADEIFGWYNENPQAKPLLHNFSKTEKLVIIGNGNVALDMARIFSKNATMLSNTNIGKNVMKTLSESSIKKITIIGRRELFNASFTPAELREFKVLTEFCKINVFPENSYCIGNLNLTRIQTKNMQIMRELVEGSKNSSAAKVINFKFSSPIESVDQKENKSFVKLKNDEKIEADLLIECTGFRQNQKFGELFQDENGRFITCDNYLISENIYACGWARTGPKGNVADSITEASSCAEEIYKDLFSKSGSGRPGSDGLSSLNLTKLKNI